MKPIPSFLRVYCISVIRGEKEAKILPVCFWANILVLQFGKSGIWFWRQGDEILWLYPWARKKYQGKKYISMLFSGDGSFGDAAFYSLKEIDKTWGEYVDACKVIADKEEKEPVSHPF
jgi:hypothetical protein